jgi:hypothetical protein
MAGSCMADYAARPIRLPAVPSGAPHPRWALLSALSESANDGKATAAPRVTVTLEAAVFCATRQAVIHPTSVPSW